MDRATEERIDDANVDAAWTDPRALVLPVREGRVPVVDGGSSLRFVSPASLNGAAPLERYFLGKDEDGAPFFAVRERPSDIAPPEGEWAGLREIGGLLSDRDAGLFVHSLALANWHAAHGFCARCGKPTQAIQGGHVRRCPACRTDHFPRTDPAIIVLVTDDQDRCLLGHGANWPEGRFSTLAGFVEPGESLESAVIREVHEESGIVVADPEYAGSQPWPFPSSLMLGFFARAVTTEIKVDGVEVTQAQWFSRAELAEAFQSGTVLPPGGVSIARRLVEAWFGSEITDTW
ncbi:NAD(+) diphosphatase [Flindersiella endophytica]